MNTENYPRISDILAVYSDFSMVNPNVLNTACERGTDVHNYCHAYAQGLWDLDPEAHLKPYVDSFKTWYDENVERYVSGEIRLYCHELKFSGRYDQLVQLKGEEGLTLIDLKTSASYKKDWPVRLAAYRYLFEVNDGPVPIKCLSIRLKKDGKKPCVKPYEDLTQYFDVFLSVLKAYNYFIRRKDKKEASNV